MAEIDNVAESFQRYMIDKGYSKINRDSLVSDTFPTCFTVSGGPNFVGKEGGPYVVVQPCHRYWDVNSVGDKTHLSFFEMGVTFSEEPKDRPKLISDQLSFLKSRGLDSLTAHYFAGGPINGKEMPTDDVKRIWESCGITDFVAHKDMEAYVANSVEPYGGPRTELFKDGEIEVFTSVLYNQRVENGKIVGDNSPSTVAAGFGLERVVQTTGDLDSISDIFNPIHENPIISDHIRGLVFLSSDGAFELTGNANSGRKSILNRYLRSFHNAFGEMNPDRLKKLIGKTIEFYVGRYPELTGKEAEFYENITERIERLSKT